MTKLMLIAVLIIGTFLCQEIQGEEDKMKEMLGPCLESEGLTEEEAKAMMKAADEDPAYVPDEKAKCLTLCILKQSGIVDSQGNVDENTMEKMHQEEHVRKECAHVPPESKVEDCDAAYAFAKRCLQ